VEDEGQFWFHAEFLFEDEQGEIWVGKSLVYQQCGSDIDCLFEDAPAISARLEEGAEWESVCRDFRQAW